MVIAWNPVLVDQLDWHWTNFVRPRLGSLTDDEYLWEPVPGCWSIRTRTDATGPAAAGSGETVLDVQFPPPTPAPFTTIAWRMAHLSFGVFGQRAVDHFGADGRTSLATTDIDWPLTAAGGVALLDHWYAAWRDGVRDLGEDGLDLPCGPSEGPFAAAPLGHLVVHINREALHHSAEIMLLRDLYLHRRARPIAQETT